MCNELLADTILITPLHWFWHIVYFYIFVITLYSFKHCILYSCWRPRIWQKYIGVHCVYKPIFITTCTFVGAIVLCLQDFFSFLFQFHIDTLWTLNEYCCMWVICAVMLSITGVLLQLPSVLRDATRLNIKRID